MPIFKHGGFFLCKQLDDRKDNLCENILITLNDWMVFAGVSNFQTWRRKYEKNWEIAVYVLQMCGLKKPFFLFILQMTGLKIAHTSERHPVIERHRNIFAKIVLSVIQLLTKKKSAIFDYRHPLGCLQKNRRHFRKLVLGRLLTKKNGAKFSRWILGNSLGDKGGVRTFLACYECFE